jgi:hypothetical protein
VPVRKAVFTCSELSGSGCAQFLAHTLQKKSKSRQSQQFAIIGFSHRHHEPPHHGPNAFMAQLKFSSRMSVLRRLQSTRAGTLGDFNRFLREAHRRGLRVITELVMNHTSDQHPWFQRARRAKPGSR